jgi:hypothetical protein
MHRTLVTGNKDPSLHTIQLVKQYKKVILQSLISMFLDLPHASIMFVLDITLCRSFVIWLVCVVAFQKLCLYEYLGKPALF